MNSEEIREISVAIYKLRLEATSKPHGAVDRMLLSDGDGGKKLRGRAGAYDVLSRAYVEVLRVRARSHPSDLVRRIDSLREMWRPSETLVSAKWTWKEVDELLSDAAVLIRELESSGNQLLRDIEYPAHPEGVGAYSDSTGMVAMKAALGTARS